LSKIKARNFNSATSNAPCNFRSVLLNKVTMVWSYEKRCSEWTAEVGGGNGIADKKEG